VLDRLKIDMLVIDHYEIGYSFEKKLKENNPYLNLMVLDDLYKKHYCDILLNHNIYADSQRYKDLVPEFCELRCGKKYMLIRDEFFEAKKLPKNKNEKFTIFLAMGGADTANLNTKILKILEKLNVKVNLVTTSANKNLEGLKKYCANKNWIDLQIDSKNIAKIMRNSDFAIVTPSVVLNEVFFMELPFLAIRIASNQDVMVEYLKKRGYLVLEYFEQNKLYNILRKEFEENSLNSYQKRLEYKKLL